MSVGPDVPIAAEAGFIAQGKSFLNTDGFTGHISSGSVVTSHDQPMTLPADGS